MIKRLQNPTVKKGVLTGEILFVLYENNEIKRIPEFQY